MADKSCEIPINDALEDLFTGIRKEQGPWAENVFMFAKGEHNLKGSEPVGARKDIAPLPEKEKAVNLLNGFTGGKASSKPTCHKSVTTSDVTPRKLNRGDRI